MTGGTAGCPSFHSTDMSARKHQHVEKMLLDLRNNRCGQLGAAPARVLGSGKGTRAFKPSQPLLGVCLALGASPCCLRTGLHCSESSVPCRVALLAQACAPFLPSAKEEAIVDLAIVGLCCKLLFCKKRQLCGYPCPELDPSPRGKAAVQTVEISSRCHLRRKQGRTSSQEGKEGSRPAIPSPPSRLESQKGWEVAEPG